jgi:release factor glutamine methyltransferase
MNAFASLTLLAARDRAAGLFADAGIEDAVSDATALLCHAAGITRAGLIANGDAPLPPDGQIAYAACVERRLAREPVTRIVGKRGFWDIELRVAPDVLDPRADTETLVAAALEIFADRRREPLRILDIGCGSGAIVCALLDQFAEASGLAIDVSAAACSLTRDNARLCGVAPRLTVQQQSWHSGISGQYDLVVSNPPYIRTGDLPALDPEVRKWDPVLALDGGADGLDAYRDLIRLAAPLLTPGGWLLLETGYDQGPDVTALLEAAGWREIRAFRDLGGHVRVLAARPPEK